MRDPKRIDKTLSVIKKIWKQYPDLRLLQLLLNPVPASKDASVAYFMEEEELIDRLVHCYGEDKTIEH